MATRDPFALERFMRSTWSWACRPRDRCPRSATYTPGYPAVEEGPSLLGDLPRRPPVVPDGNNHRAHPSAGNQMSCVMPCALSVTARKKESAFSFSFLERGAIGRSMISSVCRRDDIRNIPAGRSLSRTCSPIFIIPTLTDVIFILACRYLFS